MVEERKLRAFFFRSGIIMGLIGVCFAISALFGPLFWAVVTFGLFVTYLVGVVDGEVGVWK